MVYTEEIRIRLENYTYFSVIADPGVKMELQEHFAFFVPNYRWSPKFKAKMWDGKIRLYNPMRSVLLVGLFWELFKFCEDRRYRIIFDDHPEYGSVKDIFAENPLTEEDGKILDSIPKKFNPRDYQLDAILWALRKKRGVIKSPTGSGKSFIIYLIIMWFLQKYSNKSALIVVPTTSLVEQMSSDFINYSKDLLPESMLEKIYSGKERNPNARITISTWQSLYNIEIESFFSRFGLCILDECHQGDAKIISGVVERSFNAKYKFGFTGTLKNMTLSILELKGLFGQINSTISTKELQDRNELAALKINCIILKYPEKERQDLARKDLTYKKEVNFILSSENRNKFIARLALDQKKNTLILFNYVEKQGEPLFRILQELNQDDNRRLFYVAGSTAVDERESIRKIMESETNAITVASSGVFSTGVNIVNIHNIFFAFSTKSQIRVLQSIGRALRVGEGKTSATLFDIIDDISWKSKLNYGLKHATRRLEYYTAEKFKYNTITIDFTP